jgi:hypothetical protein
VRDVTSHPRLNIHSFRTPAGIAVLIITAIVLLWVRIAALRPLPGRDVTIATGSPDSAYSDIRPTPAMKW